ncbi:hypothetical protein DSM107010_23890 [Chroococcidiopsis cubana SAG 39.79]|uniref:Uncharacterized protein n=1 Tax=Chroococcidiopsis cubana SAG 39.79 TaxID=388085 RepID=A0AB37ULU8_9CYAN|nr:MULTISPECIES: hypothetical protein [Chroococcidiopsis]PSB49915.1 hypothetical protein C7B80_00665 [Cyanosarcina cf. burmensis CCALA 770]PSB66305.1 hypothetical protein C7B79_01645 [Chroococcidiopsis cubana CCALA 043]RUT12379.1 hypothetical protein DSM107010_23890 [Chroococcidiopsis cubana SAG 39.79]URD52464.1 hypothetical protein M5J74_10810 [Chroococcidiopsis sp. CCNUC1]
MKLSISSRRAAATLILIAAAILSGCNNQSGELTNNTQSSPNNTNTAPTSTPSARKDTAQQTSCADGNPIKGIDSKRLGKIALTPQSPVYNKVEPLRCFPNTLAAQEAGYTVPK